MLRTQVVTLGVLCTAGVLGFGCGESGFVEPNPTPEVSAVSVFPNEATLGVSESFQLNAAALDNSGQSVPDQLIQWTSADTSIAVVSTTGTVTAIKAGETEIRASSRGKRGTARVTVMGSSSTSTKVCERLVVTPKSVTLKSLNATLQASAQAQDVAGNVISGVSMSWTSLNTTIASVGSMGLIAARSVGTAAVVVAAMACVQSDTMGVVIEQEVGTIDLSPATVSVAAGSTVGLQAAATDIGGAAVTNPGFGWRSTSTSIATVNGNGVVTGVSAGTASIIVTAGTTADTSVVTVLQSSTALPPPPPSGTFYPPDIVSSDFESGSLAPFVTGASDTSNANIYVTPDPTGLLSGRVVSLRFDRGSTIAGLDVNRSIRFDHSVGFGQTIFMRGDVVIPTPQSDMTQAMRKLIYVQRRPNDISFAVIKAVGNSLKAEITNNRIFNGGSFPFDKKVSLEVQITTNSSLGANDGILRVWKDGVLVIEATDVVWLTSSNPFEKFLFGQQTQHGQNDASVLFDEYRYWDNVALSTRRIGP